MRRGKASRLVWGAVRAGVLLFALAVPVLATAGPGLPDGVIEAPRQKKAGIGFVLLVSLQRA